MCKPNISITTQQTGTLIMDISNNLGSAIMIGKGTITAEQPGTCTNYEFCIDADNDNKCTTIDKHLKNSVYTIKNGEVNKLVVDCLSGEKLKKRRKGKVYYKFRMVP
jgi:hypothetical protein